MQHEVKTIRYRRMVAVWKATASLLLLLGSTFLAYSGMLTEHISGLRRFFSITAALIGYTFFGPYFVASLIHLLKRNTVLLSYDHQHVWTNRDQVAWSQIRKVELTSSGIQKGLFPKFPQFVFEQQNGTTVIANTYYLMTDEELSRALKQLRQLVNERGLRR
ncbi:DUF5381 family protein [Paenibacillus sp. 481]|uniref:DUF5381 family protein n=1 Tax=Paenibacillus sp. 481 TaxID=2835869 RepID=UPI001E44F871|nr:DUF5381 family protein [Paenibacillus sp. 481]UHA72121.1 DUF5381 family protein [Paenibacillus sp. 481]